MPIDTDKQFKLFLLPFLYFYMLSFGLIAVSSYLLVRNVSPTKINASTGIQNKIQVQLSPRPKTIKSDAITEKTFCNLESAGKIDKFFRLKKAPLAGHGCDFDTHGQENGVDGAMVASIAWCESNGGKTTPQFGNKESFNAWGWAVFDSNDTTRNVDGYSCDSWEHCIGRVTRGISRNAAKREISTSAEDTVTWYNPGSIDRADGILANSTWLKCVNNTKKMIQNI
jgi:hypothetical protein